jgi:hypothetical protein
MPRPSSDRRAIKDRARSAPAPRAITSIGSGQPARHQIPAVRAAAVDLARRDPAKSGLDFLALLASLRGHASCCDRHRGEPVSGALGTG